MPATWPWIAAAAVASTALMSCSQTGSTPSTAPRALGLLAGSIGGMGNLDGTGSRARFASPSAVAVDRTGNIYVTDTANDTIRLINSAGRVSTIAGRVGLQGADDGVGGAALFSYPTGVAVDSAGTIYITDSLNYTIRRLTPDGVVSTLAGSPNQLGTSDGVGAAARFNYPTGITADVSGNLYVADTYNQTVRKITPQGTVSTFAGAWYDQPYLGCETVDGAGTAARFCLPQGIAVDDAGVVYVADTGNQLIRRITPDGTVTTLAGMPDSPGSADGSGSSASFNAPTGIVVDSGGFVYVADRGNSTIRKVTAAGAVTTLVGVPGISGSTDGDAGTAALNLPSGLAIDGSGTLYVADEGNNTIRQIGSNGSVTTMAGTALVSGSVDGIGAAAEFGALVFGGVPLTSPGGIATDDVGAVYVADTRNQTIRKIDAGGTVSTLAGLSMSVASGVVNGVNNGQCVMVDAAGSAARFCRPQGLAVDRAGIVYVADFSVRRVTPDGNVTTMNSYSFDTPSAIAVDSVGEVYIADAGGKIIDKMTLDGNVSVLAGSQPPPCNLPGTTCLSICPMDDGIGPAAHFCRVDAIAINNTGTVFVVDFGKIRMVTPEGVVTTLATPDVYPYRYSGLAIADDGGLYVSGGHVIVKMDLAARTTVVIGSQDSAGIALGPLPASLLYPSALAVGTNARLFIVDGGAVLYATGF